MEKEEINITKSDAVSWKCLNNISEEIELVGNINNETCRIDNEFLLALQKLMIKHRVDKIDIGWKRKF